MQFILPILDSILLYRVFTIIPSSRSTPLSSSYLDINTSLQHARMPEKPLSKGDIFFPICETASEWRRKKNGN